MKIQPPNKESAKYQLTNGESAKYQLINVESTESQLRQWRFNEKFNTSRWKIVNTISKGHRYRVHRRNTRTSVHAPSECTMGGRWWAAQRARIYRPSDMTPRGPRSDRRHRRSAACCPLGCCVTEQIRVGAIIGQIDERTEDDEDPSRAGTTATAARGMTGRGLSIFLSARTPIQNGTRGPASNAPLFPCALF